ncbi:hypothetical protein [Streptomyces sp. NPDC057694]|uniref:hypothetical protein n=1 Tax=Streptomyces sp. NPDC057694 TaxID=3346216 RepID=UPI00369823A6
MPNPAPRPADLVPRAQREALAMSGTGPRPVRDQTGGLTAAALHAHRLLSAGFGHTVPVTALGPGRDGVHGLAAFLAVYAAEQRAAQDLDVAA